MRGSVSRLCARRCGILYQDMILKNCYSTETTVKIPKKIKRGPTDLLRALSNTVKADPTAAHFKFLDDPYLIPYSNHTKRSYALSQEAGRKAAHWIKQQHADLFQHKNAEPFIEAYAPKVVYDENSEVTVEDLKTAVETFCVSDAKLIYELLKKEKQDISDELKQSLLELLSYYNGEDTLPDDLYEERWHQAGAKTTKPAKNSWKDSNMAESVFKSMSHPTASSYSALIAGMAHYGQLESAMRYFEESKEKGLIISVEAFNSLISRVNFLKENHDLMWKLILEMLDLMKQCGCNPNVGTLNAILESLSYMSTNRNAKQNALKALNEMKNLGIQPSLASYYYLLQIYYPNKSASNNMLGSILNQLSNRTLTAVDPSDTMFFAKAMEVCNINLRNVELAYQLHDLLNDGDNKKFIGDSFRESTYFRNFFFVVCNSQTFEEYIKLYNQLVPNVYIPEPVVMLALLNSLELNQAFEYLPKLWDDIVMFEQSERENIVCKVLSICAANTDDKLIGDMAKIGWNIWEIIEGQERERNALSWSGSMLGSLLSICMKADEKTKTQVVFNKMFELVDKMYGEPPVQAITDFVKLCIKDEDVDTAIKCVHFSKSVGFMETEDYAREIYKSLQLSEKQTEKLASLVGMDILISKDTKVQSGKN